MDASQSQQLVVAQRGPIEEVLGKIGSGSFGVVYKARVRGHVCAVKQIAQLIQNRALERFQRECEIMNSVRHDNIVQCLGTMHLDRPILIMELMDCNLTEFLKSPKRYHIQVDVVMNILQAVFYLHQQGIVHRDLSSANVLMKGSIAKVTDFGMSKFLDLSSINPLDLTLCPGTKHYMPPEALTNPPDYNHKIDIFSVGVLIIQILTGKIPNPCNQFLCPDFSVRKLETEIERRADHISECDAANPLKGLALHCLQNNKDDRPNADVLCAEVLKIQQLQPYLDDRRIGQQGMQLAMQHNIPQVVQDWEQLILKGQKDGHTISILHSEVTKLSKANELGEQKIKLLNSQIAALQESGRHKDEQIQDLQHRVANLEEQKSKEFAQYGETIRQQVEDYVQMMRSESDDINKQLEAENRHLKAEKSLSDAKIVELEQSFSSVSLQDSLQSQQQPSLKFEPGNSAPKGMHRWSSAVTHDRAIYMIPGRTREIFRYSYDSWSRHSDCEPMNSTLTVLNDKLVTVGGQLYSSNKVTYTNSLCTLHGDSTWSSKDYPAMQVERDRVIAVTNGSTLIVAGGTCAKTVAIPGGRNYPTSFEPLKVVEVLHLKTKQWQYVSELPFPLYHAPATICGDKLVIFGTGPKLTRQKLASSPSHPLPPQDTTRTVLTCQLTDLVLSDSNSSEWNMISEVPHSNSTCITFKGYLLAIGGTGPENHQSDEILYYDEESTCWTNLGHLEVAREQCFAAVLTNKLFVFGGKSGSTLQSSMEIGNFI
jgi:serine/threonine protein kinase